MTDHVKVKVTAEDEGVSTLLRTLSKQLGDVQKQQKRVNDEASARRRSSARRHRPTDSSRTSRRLAASLRAFRVARFVKDQLDAADALSKLVAEVRHHDGNALRPRVRGRDGGRVDRPARHERQASSRSRIADWPQGADAADAFKSIGLSAADLKNLSPDEAFLKTRRRSAAIGTGSKSRTSRRSCSASRALS
jgi:hypothetical protein